METGNMNSIDEWKTKLEQKKDEKSLKRYFDTLRFNELINEAHIALDKLQKHPLDKEVAIESRVLIKEISKRIESQTCENQDRIDSIEESLDKKFLDLDLIF